MEEIELLPCPFCGSKAEFIEHSSGVTYDVCCAQSGCYLEEGADWYLDKAEAVAMWNTRV